MRILVTNDDGVFSEGIKVLAETLAEKHEVTVVAPDGNRSAFSHSLTISRSLTFRQADISDKFRSYDIDGTPADCVKFALHYFGENAFDLVCSGINKGNNLGSDIQYSGTVAAAIEANFFGLKSIAFSNVARADFDFAANAAALREIFDDLYKKYSDEYVKNADGTYKLEGEPTDFDDDETSDVYLSRQGFVTVTPVLYDRTDYEAMSKFGDIEP